MHEWREDGGGTEIHVGSWFNQALKIERLDKEKISAEEESGQISNWEESSIGYVSTEVKNIKLLLDGIITPTITHANMGVEWQV